MFNIFLSNLFLNIYDVNFADFAGDNTIEDHGEGINRVTLSLQDSSKRLFQWFPGNSIDNSSIEVKKQSSGDAL